MELMLKLRLQQKSILIMQLLRKLMKTRLLQIICMIKMVLYMSTSLLLQMALLLDTTLMEISSKTILLRHLFLRLIVNISLLICMKMIMLKRIFSSQIIKNLRNSLDWISVSKPTRVLSRNGHLSSMKEISQEFQHSIITSQITSTRLQIIAKIS